jgi:hypothetical protein
MSKLIFLLFTILSIFGAEPAHHTFWIDDQGTAGDGKTDDTAAFKKAFATCMANSNCNALHLEGRQYLITEMIDLASSTKTGQYKSIALVGEHGSQIICRPVRAIPACIRNLNGHSGSLSDIYIDANQNVTYGFEDTATSQPNSCTWAGGRMATACGSEGYEVRHLRVSGAQWGIGIGPDTNGDVSHVHMYDISLAENLQGGIVTGNGQTADVIDNFAFGATLDGNPIGVKVNGGGFSISGGGFDSNHIDIELARGVGGQSVAFDNIRSENAYQFFKNSDQGTPVSYSPVIFRGVTWNNPLTKGKNTPTAPYVIDVGNVANQLTIEDSTFVSATTPIAFNITGYDPWSPTDLLPEPIRIQNVGTNNPTGFAAQLAKWAADPHLNFFSEGDFAINSPGVMGSGSGKIFSSSHLRAP